MPEKARVFLAEDDPGWQERIKRWLGRSNHQVILTAQTLTQALQEINQFEQMGIQVAILDGNLSTFANNSDGQRLAAAIREIAPQVKTIGLPSLGTIPGVDVDLGKARVQEVGKVVTEL